MGLTKELNRFVVLLCEILLLVVKYLVMLRLEQSYLFSLFTFEIPDLRFRILFLLFHLFFL